MDAYFTIVDLKSRWHCSKAKVYRLVKEKDIPFLSLGSRRLFPVEVITRLEAEWLESRNLLKVAV